MSNITPDQIESHVVKAFAAIYPGLPIKYQSFDETLTVSVSVGLYNIVFFRYSTASEDGGYFHFGLVMHDHTVSDLAVIRIPYPEEVS